MEQARALELLEQQIEAANDGDPGDFVEWHQRTGSVFRMVLGDDHPLAVQFRGFAFRATAYPMERAREAHAQARRSGVLRTIAIMRSAIFEITETGAVPTAVTPPASANALDAEGAVFLVHGHDEARLHETARVVELLTGGRPVVLRERPNAGRTIIEKFEDHAETASFAIVLLTGDDVGRPAGVDSDAPRARQNVVFEAGYFIGLLGRRNVVLLVERGVERPSTSTGWYMWSSTLAADGRRILAGRCNTRGSTLISTGCCELVDIPHRSLCANGPHGETDRVDRRQKSSTGATQLAAECPCRPTRPAPTSGLLGYRVSRSNHAPDTAPASHA